MSADPVKQFDTLIAASDFLFLVCVPFAPVPKDRLRLLTIVLRLSRALVSLLHKLP